MSFPISDPCYIYYLINSLRKWIFRPVVLIIPYFSPSPTGLPDGQRSQGAEEAHLAEAQGSQSDLQRVDDLQRAATQSDHRPAAGDRVRGDHERGDPVGTHRGRQLCGGQGPAPLAPDALLAEETGGHVACPAAGGQSADFHGRRRGGGGRHAKHPAALHRQAEQHRLEIRRSRDSEIIEITEITGGFPTPTAKFSA